MVMSETLTMGEDTVVAPTAFNETSFFISLSKQKITMETVIFRRDLTAYALQESIQNAKFAIILLSIKQAQFSTPPLFNSEVRPPFAIKNTLQGRYLIHRRMSSSSLGG
jgi:hypothetical protein